MGHAKLSPSSSSRWLKCPGSIAAIDALPVREVEESSVHADEGTFAHSIAERALDPVIAINVPIETSLMGLLGTKSECGRFTADKEMLEYLEEYVEFCAGCHKAGSTVWVEEKVHAIEDVVYGTADFMAVTDDVLEVVDLKYGAGVPVSPVGNTQARIYALGALLKIEARPEVFMRIKTINVHIFQPRNRAGGGVETLTRAELLAWRDEVFLPGVTATEDNLITLTVPQRVAGDHCRFCPVKGNCYAIKETALEAAKSVFDDPAELTVAETQPNPRDLSPVQIGKVLSAAPLIEAWLKGVKEYAYEQAMAGKSIEGYKLVGKKGIRKWTDTDEAEVMLRELLPEGGSPHAPPKLLSPAQSEKKLDILGKAMVAKLTTKPDTGKTLVPNSDKRQAFRPGDVFNEIEKGN